jgi:hypothetical protein
LPLERNHSLTIKGSGAITAKSLKQKGMQQLGEISAVSGRDLSEGRGAKGRKCGDPPAQKRNSAWPSAM